MTLNELFWTKKIGREREESYENAVRCAEEIAGACGGGMGGQVFNGIIEVVQFGRARASAITQNRPTRIA